MSLSLLEATIYLIILKSTFYQVNSQDISIIRDERDIFTNEAGCEPKKAVCVDKNCTYCQCEKESGTFIGKRSRNGECVLDENLANVTCKWLDTIIQHHFQISEQNKIADAVHVI